MLLRASNKTAASRCCIKATTAAAATVNVGSSAMSSRNAAMIANRKFSATSAASGTMYGGGGGSAGIFSKWMSCSYSPTAATFGTVSPAVVASSSSNTLEALAKNQREKQQQQQQQRCMSNHSHSPNGVSIGQQQQQQQQQSAQEQQQSFSSYEYPLATEAPVITRTTAAQAKKFVVAKSAAAAAAATPPPPPIVTAKYDPFDDLGTLSESDIQRQKDQWKREMEMKLKLNSSSSNNTNKNRIVSGRSPITIHVPENVPPNVPATELQKPETLLTTLDNGVRVVSQETYGQVSTVGVVTAVGSRLENTDTTTTNSQKPNETGLCHLIEMLAFGSTERYSGWQVTSNLLEWGGTRFINSGREQTLHCVDLLRPNVDKAMDLLEQVVCHSTFPEQEVEDAKRALEFQALDMPPELLLGEALQAAAYGPIPMNDTDNNKNKTTTTATRTQQLAKPHFCPADALASLTADHVRDFWNRQVITNPTGMVVGGAGVRHDALVELAQRHFGHLQQVSNADANRTTVQPSIYTGGEIMVNYVPANNSVANAMEPDEKSTVRVVLALEVGGWLDEDLVATCVLQTLLGGGNSFSAGGPGKGMYSRLYRQVLNRYTWAESAEAVNAFHGESGLWGISASTKYPHRATEMVHVLAEQIARLASEPVSQEELNRARNMLKCNVLTQLESRLVLFEDLARQVLTYGKREDMLATCRKIDSVTAEDLQRLVQKALQKPPTLAAVGEDLSQVPHVSDVHSWLGVPFSQKRR